MSEPETEIDTLDRLEAALGRIAEHVNRPAGRSSPDATRQSVVIALDRMIVQLREALAAIGPTESK
ncbi:hypothetical protein [Acidiphilium sp.]|uniref:hypothetical protein n=1 Tax=Acidiphilium sp. TaxID=527 RepID=UPI003CFCFD27